MAYASSVYAAKDALETLLNAHTWPDTAPSVMWGEPTEADDQPFDAVYFGNAGDIVLTHRVIGRPRADEEYRVPIVVDVRRYGDDEKATERRMWDLHDEIVGLLHNNLTLDGTINRMGDITTRPGSLPAGALWRSQCVIEVSVVAQIAY